MVKKKKKTPKKQVKRKPAKKRSKPKAKKLSKKLSKKKAKKPAKCLRSVCSRKRRGGRKPLPKDQVRNELISCKVSGPELDQIFAKADKLAEGSVSKLLRHAVLSCKTKAK